MMMDGCDAGGVVLAHIFVLFLLKLIFHGFRLTHETTLTCISPFRYAGIVLRYTGCLFLETNDMRTANYLYSE